MVNKADEELLAQSAVMVGNEGENTPEEGAKEGAGGDSEGAVGEVNDGCRGRTARLSARTQREYRRTDEAPGNV